MHNTALRTATITLLAMTFTGSAVHADVVTRHNVKFEIEYDDGLREIGKIRYEAHLDPVCVQSSSELDAAETDDTRRVRLSVNGLIRRDICIISRALGEACDSVWTKVFEGYSIREDKRWEPFHSVSHNTTCKKQRDQLRLAAKDVEKAILAAMPEIVDGDLDEALSLLKISGVKRVIKQD